MVIKYPLSMAGQIAEKEGLRAVYDISELHLQLNNINIELDFFKWLLKTDKIRRKRWHFHTNARGGKKYFVDLKWTGSIIKKLDAIKLEQWNKEFQTVRKAKENSDSKYYFVKVIYDFMSLETREDVLGRTYTANKYIKKISYAILKHKKVYIIESERYLSGQSLYGPINIDDWACDDVEIIEIIDALPKGIVGGSSQSYEDRANELVKKYRL